MATTRIIRHIAHGPKDLMELVSDVEAYPEFINLLSALRVTNRKSISDVHEQFEADATVTYKFISESFRSTVNIFHDLNRIKVTKSDRAGALRVLDNTWHFHELSDGSTLIDFHIEVKLKAFPLEMLLREKFASAGEKIMSLFVVKARQECPKIGDASLDLAAEYKRLNLPKSAAKSA